MVGGWFTQRAAERAAGQAGEHTVCRGQVSGGQSGHRNDGRRADARAGSARADSPACGADVRGEVCLLSYARVASGPQFSVFARTPTLRS